jgi:guanine deaminase
MDNDRSLLLRAIELAKKGISSGGGPFGAVITRDGQIISEAYNNVIQNHDPTAHAEILAIRQAARDLGSHDLNGCTLYSSCEPCPMCLGAIYWSGIKKVIYASDRSDAETAGFGDKFIYEEMALDPGDRKVEFNRITGPEDDEVFAKWKMLDSKIMY